MSTRSATFRRLLREPGLVRAPGVFDGISAHLVRRAGFPVAYATGAGIAASGFGLPDVGLLTATEMIERVGMLAAATDLPLLADADTGYGNPMHVVRTVRAYEQAGVAALHLEDQAFPKRCGHLADKEIVDVDEFLPKLAAALENREDDIVVVARTDANGPLGIDEAIERARRYAAEGADAVFVEAPRSHAEIERIADEVGRATGVPLVFNVVPGGLTPVLDDAELERLGFALAVHPGALLVPVADAAADALAEMGGTTTPRVTGPADLFGLVGLTTWLDLDQRYGKEAPTCR
ncbi:isocitrate lyase/PEP mutase family protein [Actinomycetospora sp. CA-084318]|uniref:isocitrate lyase/PEP mutase family protein n=1 Tax=Actinomycetospora sp. CA-084318 TaxID=3239892 RepID=UPI003D9766A9